jgi:uncharacterized protein YegL
MSEHRLDQVEFVDNPEPRCAVVLLLDTSYSMSGQPISELNAGIRAFEQATKEDDLASLRVEVSIVTFGGHVSVVQPFVTVGNFESPTLTVNGNTPMGAAVDKGLALINERKETYKQNGVDYFRPWLFLITDGAPTDSWEAAAERLKQEEGRKGVSVFCIGVENANLQTLSRFSNVRAPVKLKGLAFRELFIWLSKSLSSVSQARPGEQVELPPSEAWTQFDTSH